MKKKLDDAESQMDQAVKSMKKKGLGSSRGIETLFRASYRVQMELTALADNKANMMISINGIIMSIIIAAVAPKLDANPWLMIPSTIFLVGTLVSIIYAILAARPRVSNARISLEDLAHSKGNLLFFGDFANLSQDDFTKGMINLIQDNNTIYETMVRNLYGLGSVLKKKFHLLKLAYTAFMIALILGVTSYIGVFVWVLKTAPVA